jgi:hypothetical protein
MRYLFEQKQMPSQTKLSVLITVLTLSICTISYSQVTPPTSYPCDYRNYPGQACPVDCVFPATVEKGCNCFDGINNDGDVDGNGVAMTDARDPDCASYYGLSFIGEGSDCSITPPGALTPFEGMSPPVASSQNTSDTQSKVAAGDIDGNLTPDVVITAKFNGEVRIIATAPSVGVPEFGGDSFAEGTLIADFKAKNLTLAACDGGFIGKVRIEHEVLIADIDRDGDSEIFTIVSVRDNPPISVPNAFYLLALTLKEYGADGLELLYQPVCLGKNRPGIFGIADMDGDQKAEIYIRDRIFAAETGKLLASEGGKSMISGGTSRWDVDVPAAPVAVNMDGATDGFKLELVVGAQIYKIPTLTNRNPASPGTLTLWKDMNSLAFNIDGVAGNDQYFVKLMNDPAEYGIDTHSAVSVGDIDKDGQIDVILTGAVNASNGRTAIFYWNIGDNTVTGMCTPNSAELAIPAAQSPDYANYLGGWLWGTGRINIGDANGDGNLDFSFVAGSHLFCVTTTASNQLVSIWAPFGTQVKGATVPSSGGNMLATYRVINDSRSGVTTATIYDFSNDGVPEMVYRDSYRLTVISGATGLYVWDDYCLSHTYTEGPIIADVNGDGNTDIACACYTSDGGAGFTANGAGPIQEAALGQVRIWYSDGQWLPTRRVWNQPGYFVVNINDDLTLPFPQMDIATQFGDSPCPNGTPGPQTPYNVFLNQVPFLSANGCPVFPAPDLTFIGDDPNDPTYDPNDPNNFPTVFVESPICGNLDIRVGFNVTNSGDLPISTNIPISFFAGSPYTAAPGTGTLLYTTTIPVNNLQVGDTLSVGDYKNALGQIRTGDLPFIEFDGPGTTFEMYVVLYNNGQTLPIDTVAINNSAECDITNNYWPIMVVPTPFTVNIDSVDNVKCLPTSPNSGELISHISVGADTVIDLSPYTFQWYQSDQVTPIAGETNYNITGLAAGDYYLVITNTQKGCSSDPILGQVVDGPLYIPGLRVRRLSHQTNCEPPNGSLIAEIYSVVNGDTITIPSGYEFAWEDIGGPIGQTGATLQNSKSGTYTVIVEETSSGCQTSADGVIGDFTLEPDVVATSVDVVNCVNASSGSVSATAFFNGVAQDSSGYVFEWYFYDETEVDPLLARGSIVPGNTGNPTVKGLPVGYYEVVITQIATGCKEANTAPDTVEIADETVLPVAQIVELAPQTSCDPLLPNGRLRADAYINGVLQDPANFTFEWFVGQNTVTPHTGGTSGTNGQVAENVRGGGQAYTVRITTANDCSVIEDGVVSEIIRYPQVTLSTTPNSVCDIGIGLTGSVSVATLTFNGSAVTLPNPNYSLTWYNGSTVVPANERVADVNKSTINLLDSGFYTLVVENTLLNCPSVANVEQVLSLKALPIITADADSSTNCKPLVSGNGRVKLTAIDGVAVNAATHDFTWHRGPNELGPAIGVLDDAVVDTLQGKSPNNFFTIFVRNQTSGCENTETVEVIDAKVLPLLTLAPQPNTVCDPSLIVPPGATFTGSVTGTVSNAAPGGTYAYVWDDLDPLGVNPLDTDNIIDQRDSSTYQAIVTHVETGCVSNPVTADVTEVTTAPVIDADGIPSTNCIISLANGQAVVNDVDAGGGVGAPYTFRWFLGTDVTGALRGNTAATLDSLQGKTGKFYTVEVTNTTDGCVNTETVEVQDLHVLPLVTLDPTPNTVCDASLILPAGTGSFTGTVTGTISNAVVGDTYNYAWDDLDPTGVNPVDTDNVIAQRDSSTYQAIVTHVETGCVSDPVTADVTEITAVPDIEASDVPSTNCDPALANGRVEVTDVDSGGGIGAPYTFRWFLGTDITGPLVANAPATPDTLQGKTGKFYFVEVINRNDGCLNTEVIELADDSELPTLTLASTPNTICDVDNITPDGTVTATITNEIIGDTYTFAWLDIFPDLGDPLIGDTDGAIAQRDSSTYQAIVTHVETGCVSNPEQIDVDPNLFIPPIDIGVTNQTSCDNLNPNGVLAATIDETAIGGSATENSVAFYTFTWTNKGNPQTDPGVVEGTTPTISDLEGNLFYTIDVRRTLTGCANSDAIFLPEIITYPVVVAAVSSDVSSCSTPNGAILADVGGVENGYTFFWLNEVGTNSTTDADDVVNNADVTSPNNGDYLGLIPGNYTVAVRDDATSCLSQPLTRTVNDVTLQTVINITLGPVLPSACGAFDGQMTASVTGGSGSTVDFSWHLGGPINNDINFFTNPPQFTAPNDVPFATLANQALVPGPAMSSLSNLESRLYTLIIHDDGNGCGNYQTVFLPFNDAHIINTALTPSTICPYTIGNGEIEVTVSNIIPGTNDFQDYIYRLYEGENPDPANEVGSAIGPGGAVLNPQAYSALAPGKYTVEVRQDFAAFGSNCAVFEVVEIESQALAPVITLVGSLKANTACNVVAAADGEAEISVNKDPNDLTVWIDYDIEVTPAPLGWGGTITKAGPYPPTGLPENETILGLSPDNIVPEYTIKVTSSNGCSSERFISIPNQPAVSELVDGDISIVDAFFCDPSGHIEVKSINVIGGGANPDFTNIGNYQFTWFNNVGLTPATGIFQAQGNPAPAFGGERLDSISYAAIAPGSYWVRAVKTLGTDGIGCLSAPFKADIIDRSVNPTIELTPYSNTSCLTMVFEGSISVKMDDNSLVPGPFTYRYDWDEVTNPVDIETALGFPPASGVPGNNGNGLNTPADRDSVTQLQEGVYKLTAYNEQTGCRVNGQTTVLKTTVPIIIAGVDSDDKFFCMPSGKAMVTEVKVGTATEPNGNFDFTWREALVTNAALPVAANVDQLDSISFPTITNNSLTYFVEVAKRAAAGAPGAGCKSAPVRIDISDQSVNPTIELTPYSNTSCATMIFEGSIAVKMDDNSIVPAVPPGPYLYRYDWDEVTNPIDIETALGFPPASGIPGNNGNGLNTAPVDRDSVTQLQDGVYRLTAYNQTTGCRVNGQTTVLKTTVPIIIAGVEARDKFFCMPSGKALVTDVQVGGQTEANTNFDFVWREAVVTNPALPLAANIDQLDSISYTTITNNSLTYFVEVTKRLAAGAPGAGCKSAPARIDITDRSVNPTIALTPYSNTSCTTLIFEGAIAVKMDDNSIVPAVPPGPYLYRYDWDEVTNPVDIETALGFPASGVTGNNGNGLNTPADRDSVMQLEDGVYRLTAYNQTTGCRVNGQTTVLRTTVPIIIANVSQIDKYRCVPSGQAIVREVQVGGAIEPNGNFDFTWREDLITNAPLAVPVNTDQLDSAVYATITDNSFTYFVEVTKRIAAGAPGAGCKSAPARIDIVDRHVNPIPQLVSFANSSCTGAFLNGAITISVRDTQGPGVGQLYDYENFTNGVLAPATLLNNNGNALSDGLGPDNDSIPNLAEGTYTFLVRNQETMCTTAASVTIQYDPVASKPNIIDVDTNLPFDCLGGGGDATVTAITIGGGPQITGSPALDPPNFNYDWYDNVTDAFAVPPNVPGNLPTNQRSVSPLPAGRYWVAVRDLLTDCKSNPTEVFIDSLNIVYPHISIQQTSLQLSCDVTFGTASLKALADGQDDTDPDYFFTWYNNLTATNPEYSDPLVSTDSIGDLTTGDYSVRVLQNSTGCEATKLFIIPALDPQFLPNMALTGDEQSSCIVDNGSIVIRVLPFPVANNGLTYPFTPDFKVDLYNGDLLSGGLNQEPPAVAPDKANIPPMPIAPPPGSFISDTLFIGKYTIRLRDNNTGCIVVDTTSVRNLRRDPIPNVIVENPLTNCDTRFNGQLSASADGRPTGNYDFSWWNAASPPPGGTILGTNDKLIGVDQGTYEVLIVNKASGCDTVATGTVGFEPVFPPAPDIKLIQPQIVCWENFYPADPLARPTGWLQASVGGEVLGYRFDWYTGQFDRNGIAGLAPDTTGINNRHLTGNFGSDPGVYTLSAVILTTGCYSVTTAVVPDERVLPVGIIETTPSFCPDVGPPGFTGTGSVLLELTNDVNVTLSSILWYDNISNASVGDGGQVFNLPPGFYRAEFISSYFCEGEAVGEVRTEVKPYNLVSSNGDNENDAWVIDCISNYTVDGGAKRDNNVKIFNRYGVLVYEADGYNNNDVIFKGIGENGLYAMGNDLPDGTYFYIIDKRDGSKPLTGFLELVR